MPPFKAKVEAEKGEEKAGKGLKQKAGEDRSSPTIQEQGQGPFKTVFLLHLVDLQAGLGGGGGNQG